MARRSMTPVDISGRESEKEYRRIKKQMADETTRALNSLVTVICADCYHQSSYSTTNELRFRTSMIPTHDSKNKGLTYIPVKLRCPACNGNNFMKLQQVMPDGTAPFVSAHAELTCGPIVAKWREERREDKRWHRKVEGRRAAAVTA